MVLAGGSEVPLEGVGVLKEASTDVASVGKRCGVWVLLWLTCVRAHVVWGCGDVRGCSASTVNYIFNNINFLIHLCAHERMHETTRIGILQYRSFSIDVVVTHRLL